MRIVSLLPSATEIVFALGLEDSLVGVSFECDHPPAARTKPVVSGTALPTEAPLTALEIDEAVRDRVAAGESLYTLDTERIRSAAPDVILAQDLCAVCAVPSGQVEDALDVIGCRAEVVSLDPASLDDVIACIGRVGAATGRREPCRSCHVRPARAPGRACGRRRPALRARVSSLSNGRTRRSAPATGCPR